MPTFLSPVGVIGPEANGPMTVGTNTTTAAGGLWFGTDTSLYRSNPGMLRTDGAIRIGGEQLGTPTTARAVVLDAYRDTFSYPTLSLMSSDVAAIDKGGSLGFGGYFNGASGSTMFARIAGAKADAVDGNYGGYLTFGTRATGGNMTERMRIAADGAVTVPGTVAIGSNPAAQGTIRLPDTGAIWWRNSANTADAAEIQGISGILYYDQLSDSGYHEFRVGAAYTTSLRLGMTQALLNTHLSIADGKNVVIGTSAGTQWATGPTQKQAFWGATAVTQPANSTTIDSLLTNTGLRASGGTANFTTAITTAGNYVAVGTNVSSIGTGLRLPTNSGIYARNGANTGDHTLFNVNDFDNFNLNASGSANLYLYGPLRVGANGANLVGFWGATPVMQNTGWSVTAGYSADKSFNPETASLLESNRVLGTLIDLLKTYGLLGA